MKSRDFAQVLTQVAYLTGESQVRHGMTKLADVFDQAGAASVAGTLKRVVPGSEGLSTGPLLPHMRQVQSLLAFAGKPAVAKDFNEVVRLVQQYPVIAFADAKATKRARAKPRAITQSAALKADLVSRYNGELGAALGNEAGFAAVYSRLERDSQMRPAEMRELSRQFSGAPGKSKAEALRKIWSRHQNLLVARAKDRAMAGRSAA